MELIPDEILASIASYLDINTRIELNKISTTKYIYPLNIDKTIESIKTHLGDTILHTTMISHSSIKTKLFLIEYGKRNNLTVNLTLTPPHNIDFYEKLYKELLAPGYFTLY